MLRRSVAGHSRQFHACATRLFKQKTNDSKKKTWTPKKGSGEFRNFKRAAAYSHFQKTAVEVPIDQNTLLIVTKDDLADLPLDMLTYPDRVQADLIHMGSFPPQQNSELFRTHASLGRQETASLARHIEKASQEESTSHRYLVHGASGTGKTTLLSQAHAFAKLNDWVVLHLPRAYDLVDGSTDALAGDNGKFFQPMWVRRWLKRVAKANKDTLPASLTALARDAAKGDPKTLLDKFIQGLVAENVPVLFTLDSLNAWAAHPFAANRDKENNPIYHGDLEVPSLFLDFLSGRRAFPKGAVIAATSSLFPSNDTISVALGRGEAHAFSDLTEFDPRLAESLQTVKAIEVPYFSKDEVTKYLRYLSAAGVGPEPTPEISEEKYAISGNGNPQAILKSCINFSY